IGYEAQLINALINSRAGLKARPDIEWSGEGEGLKCKVTATFIGESKPKEFEAEIKPIKTRNSPLWVQQPKQQLAYFALRAWARIHCPDVIMGLYTKEEIEDTSYHHGADNALDVTPKESSVLDSLNSAINQAKTADVETKPAATPAAPEQNVQDYLDDIATAPTAEGVAFKFTDAVELFSDAKDYSLLVKARDARILELENFNASKSEVPAFLRKGMFSEQ
ncbi:MAG: recombinase RecT, partial [Pseudomonadota bacterium]